MKKTFNNRRKPESESITNSQRFQGAFNNPDKEILKRKGIKSPDLQDMPFRVQEGKTTRYFATQEKYDNYMKRKIV